jgi:Fe-S-cluster containining protein
MDGRSEFTGLREAWASIASKYEAYKLVLPGDASFLCQPAECDAYCCRTFSVSMGDREVVHFESESGLERAAFLELEDGEPIALPLAQPYLLARSEGRCSMLGGDLACAQYEARPDACRLFPYQILFVDDAQHRSVRPSAEEQATAITELLKGEMSAGVAAFLVGHTQCPGFTAAPLSRADWEGLVRRIHGLQFVPEPPGPGTAAPPAL